MITLTNALAVSSGSTSLESNQNAAVVNLAVNWPANALTFEVQPGNFASGVFGPSSRFPSVMVTLNLLTGAWSSTNGLNGTLSASALASVVNNFKNDRNTAESFCVSAGIAPGTQTPW